MAEDKITLKVQQYIHNINYTSNTFIICIMLCVRYGILNVSVNTTVL
jgi:hypothetical protein